MLNKFIFFLLLSFIYSSFVFAQVEIYKNESSVSDSTFIMQKSPTIAMLKSALIPGWGQFYNESYWKIPVVWGFLGYYLSVWISQNQKYNLYKDKYSQSISTLIPDGDTQLKKYRDFYHNQRDEFTIYIFITYFLNIVDAYVDSHLFDFNVTPDIDKIHLGIRVKL